MSKIEQLEKEIKELKKIAEIREYQKENSREIIIDNVAFTREQVFVLNSINAIREYNQNQKAIECLKELNEKLTDIIIAETEDISDFKFEQALERISASFYELLKNKIKELEKNNDTTR